MDLDPKKVTPETLDNGRDSPVRLPGSSGDLVIETLHTSNLFDEYFDEGPSEPIKMKGIEPRTPLEEKPVRIASPRDPVKRLKLEDLTDVVDGNREEHAKSRFARAWKVTKRQIARMHAWIGDEADEADIIDGREEFSLPSFYDGLKHARSTMALKHSVDKFGQPIPGRSVRPFSVWSILPCCKHGSMKPLGLGVHLYFHFYHDLWVAMFLATMLHIPHLVLNGMSSTHESWTWTNRLSLGANGDSSQHWSQAFLEFLVVCIFILLLVYYRWSVIVAVQRHRAHIITSSDYTIQIRNLQRGFRDKGVLKNYFSKYGDIHDVVIVGNVKEVMKQYNRRENAATIYEERLARSKLWSFCWRFSCCRRISPLLFRVDAAENRVDGVNRKFEKMARSTKENFRTTGSAFVTFEDQWSARRALKDLKRSGARRMWDLAWCQSPRRFFGRKLNVRTAPEPSDVIWANMHVTKRQRLARVFCTWIVVFAILVCALAIIIPIEVSKVIIRQEFEDVPGSSFIVSLISVVLGFVVVLVNFLLKKAVIFLSIHEMHQSNTDLAAQTLRKIVFVQFINTVLITFAVRPLPSLWYSEGGTADSVFYISLVNAVWPSINSLLKIPSLLRRARCFFALTQRSMNKSLLPPSFVIYERYAQLIKTVSLALVFGPMNPLVYIITFFIGLTLQYFTDKIQIIRICRRPPEFSHRLAGLCRSLLRDIFFIYVVFQYVWYTVQGLKSGESSSDFIVTIVFCNLSLLAAAMYALFPESLIAPSGKTQKLARTVVPKEERREFRDLCATRPGFPGLQKYGAPLPEDLYNSWMNTRYAHILRKAARRKMTLEQYRKRTLKSYSRNAGRKGKDIADEIIEDAVREDEEPAAGTSHPNQIITPEEVELRDARPDTAGSHRFSGGLDSFGDVGTPIEDFIAKIRGDDVDGRSSRFSMATTEDAESSVSVLPEPKSPSLPHPPQQMSPVPPQSHRDDNRARPPAVRRRTIAKSSPKITGGRSNADRPNDDDRQRVSTENARVDAEVARPGPSDTLEMYFQDYFDADGTDNLDPDGLFDEML